ncbi:MAG: hypothetical protein QXI58_06850, partial [Candidatus Micrarchaeia archaeon]
YLIFLSGIVFAYLLDSLGFMFSFQTPIFLSFQRFYINPPKNCFLEMKNWTYKINNETQLIDLPKLDQPSNSKAHYYKTINLNDSISKIYVSFVDDYTELFIDKKYIASHSNTLKPAEISIILTKGSHDLEFKVENIENVGGIGQVMLCK